MDTMTIANGSLIIINIVLEALALCKIPAAEATSKFLHHYSFEIDMCVVSAVDADMRAAMFAELPNMSVAHDFTPSNKSITNVPRHLRQSPLFDSLR